MFDLLNGIYICVEYVWFMEICSFKFNSMIYEFDTYNMNLLKYNLGVIIRLNQPLNFWRVTDLSKIGIHELNVIKSALQHRWPVRDRRVTPRWLHGDTASKWSTILIRHLSSLRNSERNKIAGPFAIQISRIRRQVSNSVRTFYPGENIVAGETVPCLAFGDI